MILGSHRAQIRIFLSPQNKAVFPVNITIKWKVVYIEMWRQCKHRSEMLSANLTMFKMVMTEEDLNVTLNLLEAFTSTMDKHNLTYFMAGGTLLGVVPSPRPHSVG